MDPWSDDAPPPGSAGRPTPAWAVLLLLALVVVITVVLAYGIPSVISPLWEPALVGGAGGMVALAVVATTLVALYRRAGHLTWGVPIVLAVAVTSTWWAPRLQLWVNWKAAAAASGYLASNGSPFCSEASRYRQAFEGLVDAEEVCVDPRPGHSVVTIRATSVPAVGDEQMKVPLGLLYAPAGVKGGRVELVCVRHVGGPWWVYQTLVLNCPIGMQGYGAG